MSSPSSATPGFALTRSSRSVLPQIRHLRQGYPSGKLDLTLNLLETQQRQMHELLGAHVNVCHTAAGADYAPSAFPDTCTAADTGVFDFTLAAATGAPGYDYLVNTFPEPAALFPQPTFTSLDATDLSYLSHVPVDTFDPGWSVM